MPDGTERPIGFVPRTLSATERKYSQIEKEALACVVGVTRYHSFLWCHYFTLQTDHKPLATLSTQPKQFYLKPLITFNAGHGCWFLMNKQLPGGGLLMQMPLADFH